MLGQRGGGDQPTVTIFVQRGPTGPLLLNESAVECKVARLYVDGTSGVLYYGVLHAVRSL